MFFLFQSIYGWTGIESTFREGYSTISFMGLYLLAGYLKKYQSFFDERFSINQRIALWGGGYLISSILIVCIYLIGSFYNFPTLMFSYTNPLIIFSSVCLLLLFSNLHFQNKIVNYIGSSCFAVYLFHHDSWFISLYIESVRTLYNSYNGIVCLVVILVFLLFVFLLAIFLDRVRLYFWKCFDKNMDRIADKYSVFLKIWGYKSI